MERKNILETSKLVIINFEWLIFLALMRLVRVKHKKAWY